MHLPHCFYLLKIRIMHKGNQRILKFISKLDNIFIDSRPGTINQYFKMTISHSYLLSCQGQGCSTTV